MNKYLKSIKIEFIDKDNAKLVRNFENIIYSFLTLRVSLNKQTVKINKCTYIDRSKMVARQANCSIRVHQVTRFLTIPYTSEIYYKRFTFNQPPNWHRAPFYFIRYIRAPLLFSTESRICVTARFIVFLFLRSKRGKYFLLAKRKKRETEKNQ